jgi:hypothetical protein
MFPLDLALRQSLTGKYDFAKSSQSMTHQNKAGIALQYDSSKPDKPPSTKVGVYAGSSQERANTLRFHQLASCVRSSHCSSGNVSSLAANASYGKSRHQAIYCVHAVLTSHEFNRELSWKLPRCGRSRVQRDTCAALCRPSSNLGRNLFPPRRFSYHTRFSGVQWHSVTSVTSNRYLACTTLQPALCAVVRCSQVPRWGQTK